MTVRRHGGSPTFEYWNEDFLRERYHGDGLTQQDIAEECNVGTTTIARWMKRHGIETRPPAER